MSLKRGSRVIAGANIQQRRHAVDWPGWEHPDHKNFLLDIPAGLTGTVIWVESHGSNPWTRYSVRFDDDSTAHGMYPSDLHLAS